MKRKLTLLLLVLCLIGGAVLAQKTDNPYPIPPDAHAEFCGNVVVLESDRGSTLTSLSNDGCVDLHATPLVDGYWLIYGTKVIIN